MLKFSCAAVTKAAGSALNKDNFELGGKCAPMNHGDFSAAYEGDSKEPFIAAVVGGDEHITKGKYASFMVCRDLAYTDGNLPSEIDECAENMTEAILNSNDMVCETIKSEEAGNKGITIAAALFADGRMRYTNLGDARVYLLRNGDLRKLTNENTSNNANTTEVNPALNGAETPAPKSEPLPEEENLYSEALEFDNELVFSLPEYKDVQLMKGDKILICGSSVFSNISDDEIKNILNSKDSVSERAEALISAAYKNGARGDMTAALIEVKKNNKFAAFIGEMNATRYIGLALIVIAIIIVLVYYLPELRKHSPADSNPTESPVEIFTPAASPTPDVVITGRKEPTPAPLETEKPTPIDTTEPELTLTPEPTFTPVPTPVPVTPAPTQASVPPTFVPTEEPKPTEEPPTEEPITEEPITGEPQTDEPPTGEPQTDEPPTGEPQTDEPPTGKPPTDEPPTEETPTEETPTDELPTGEP